ncbi:MAG: BolA family transcriptional regulator [Betaproteobacteria bacterium]|nr:BolA family transcriptional regulator [Betaproteobacteria bacterium]
MNIEELIRERLSRLAPDALEVFDDSHEHAGHAGAKDGGGHFQLVIVSREFTGKPAVARHRLVYEALSDLMPKQIHALAIRAYAPEELGTSAKG